MKACEYFFNLPFKSKSESAVTQSFASDLQALLNGIDSQLKYTTNAEDFKALRAAKDHLNQAMDLLNGSTPTTGDQV